jgi:hypothetical protein
VITSFLRRQGEMKSVRRTFLPMLLGVLVAIVDHVPQGPDTTYGRVASAAPSPNTGGQGVSGRPQKNGTITGTPKANPSINESQIRGRR